MQKNLALIVILVTVFFIGCREKIVYHTESSERFKSNRDTEGTKPGLRIRDPNFPETQIRLNNVGIVDDSIRYKIAIEATNSTRTPTQTLQVWAQIRNRTDFPLQVECRVQWFDKNKAPVDKPSAWQRIQLPPNSLETYKETSTNVYDVAYYYIEIREG